MRATSGTVLPVNTPYSPTWGLARNTEVAMEELK